MVIPLPLLHENGTNNRRYEFSTNELFPKAVFPTHIFPILEFVLRFPFFYFFNDWLYFHNLTLVYLAFMSSPPGLTLIPIGVSTHLTLQAWMGGSE